MVRGNAKLQFILYRILIPLILGAIVVFKGTMPSTKPIMQIERNGHSYVVARNGETILWDEPLQFYRSGWSDMTDQFLYSGGLDGEGHILLQNRSGETTSNLSGNNSGDYNPIWSPDGKKIAFTSVRSGSWDIWVMNADGTSLSNITGEKYNQSRDPAWSPDGGSIVFTSFHENSQSGSLFVINADGTNPRQIAMATAIPPIWLSNGQQIAFVSSSATLFVTDISGYATPMVTVPQSARLMTLLDSGEIAISYIGDNFTERTMVVNLQSQDVIVDVEGQLVQ